MTKIIKFEIVTPEKVVLKENIIQVSVPTKMGEITVLPDHIPLVASLQPGIVEIVKSDGSVDVMSLSGGFVEVLKDKVVILADSAERAEELDIDRIDEARKKAEDAIKNIRSSDREHFASINASLSRELARTRAYQRWKKIKRK